MQTLCSRGYWGDHTHVRVVVHPLLLGIRKAAYDVFFGIFLHARGDTRIVTRYKARCKLLFYICITCVCVKWDCGVWIAWRRCQVVFSTLMFLTCGYI